MNHAGLVFVMIGNFLEKCFDLMFYLMIKRIFYRSKIEVKH